MSIAGERGPELSTLRLFRDAVGVLLAHGFRASLTVGSGRSALAVVASGGGGRTYAVVVRERLTAAAAAAIDVPADLPLLVLAAHLGDPVADVLRARGIDFVDAAGNVHLAWDGLLIDVRGRRPAPPPPRSRSAATSRAFTRSGVQVIFVLLGRPGMAARPLREIARAAAVSLGTAHVVLEDLTSAGYLREGPDGRALVRGGELLGRWAEAYGLRLSARLRVAAFDVDDPRWWDGAEVELAEAGVQLGGELAGSLLDPHLRPTTATLYADVIPAALIARHRMRRDDDGGTVLVRRRFWRLPDDASPLVPAPLVYADLAASGDARQRAHADRLRAHEARLTQLDRS